MLPLTLLDVAGTIDFVLDCIDDVKTKCDLLGYCVQHKIRVMTAMGAGAKADPTRIHIGDISDSISTCTPHSHNTYLRTHASTSGCAPVMFDAVIVVGFIRHVVLCACVCMSVCVGFCAQRIHSPARFDTC